MGTPTGNDFALACRSAFPRTPQGPNYDKRLQMAIREELALLGWVQTDETNPTSWVKATSLLEIAKSLVMSGRTSFTVPDDPRCRLCAQQRSQHPTQDMEHASPCLGDYE